MAELLLVRLDGLGFVRGKCDNIAGKARVRLAEIAQPRPCGLGFVRPNRVEAT